MPVLRRLGCSVLALGLLAGCAPPRTGPASSPTNNGAKATRSSGLCVTS